ncbi:MAG: hypothetical protein Q4E52_08180 [Fibrobacter sp.]|nr:hypothetical protein [Fibrobacter sp.]
MLYVFRTVIFAFGLGILLLAMHFIHGDADMTRGQIFAWISVIVMYFMVLGPFTFLPLLPKTKNFDKMIAVYTASWYAISSYCAASIVLLIFVVKRELLIARVMGLPDSWIETAKELAQDSELVQKAMWYNDLIFNACIILQLIFLFVLLIKIYTGCFVAHKIGQVAETQKKELSFIQDLRMESQLLAQECGMNTMISSEVRQRLVAVKEDMRFLSPVNNALGHDYEMKMLDAIRNLRSLCMAQNDSSAEMTQILNNLKLLTDARRLILKQ